jgi:signal transduction histidine kinase
MLSRVESQSTELPRESLDLREIMERAGERFKLLAKERGLNIVYDFDETPVVFEGDEAALLKVIGNLVSNALRYAKTTITLRAHQTSDRVILSVEDDGEGIDPQSLPHLFERFFKDARGHYGIGLSIVKSITEAYGGRVEARSEPGLTSFTLTF